MDVLEKLARARSMMLIHEPFYAHFAMVMHWRNDDSIIPKTMGVYIDNVGRVHCIWHREFVERSTVHQLCATINHEVEHIVRLHCIRGKEYHPKIHNIAADMCVNGRKDDCRIAVKMGAGRIHYPLPSEDVDKLVFIPKSWPDMESSDYYYQRLITESDKFAQMHKSYAQGSSGDGDGQSGDEDDQNGQKKSKSGGGSKGNKGRSKGGGGNQKNESEKIADRFADSFDFHGRWGETLDPNIAREVIREMTKQAISRSQGRTPGHLKSAIEELDTPIVNWRALFRQYVGRHLGGYRLTFARRNRRYDQFGIKGRSTRAASKVSVVVDTSGSISDDDLKQFFTEIESMAKNAAICVLLWDADFQGFYPKYRRGDYQKIEMNGRGGTDMALPIEWLIDNGQYGDVCVMLTDGYCNYTEDKHRPFMCVLIADGSEPDWGMTINLEDLMKT